MDLSVSSMLRAILRSLLTGRRTHRRVPFHSRAPLSSTTLTCAYVLPHNSLSKVLAEVYVTTSLAARTPSLLPASVVISCVLMLRMGSEVLMLAMGSEGVREGRVGRGGGGRAPQ